LVKAAAVIGIGDKGEPWQLLQPLGVATMMAYRQGQ